MKFKLAFIFLVAMIIVFWNGIFKTQGALDKTLFNQENISDYNTAQDSITYGLRTAENNSYAVSVRRNYSPGQGGAIRFEVRQGDNSFNGSRSQVRLNPGFAKRISFEVNVAQYEYEGDFFSIADWHTTLDYQKAYSHDRRKKLSPLAIQLDQSNFVFINRANSVKYKVPARYVRFPIKDGWNKIEMLISESDRNYGKIIVTVNGVRRTFDNVATTWDIDFPTYFKFGIYRKASYKSTSVLEFRNVFVDGQLVMPDFSKRAAGEKVGRK